MAKQEAKKTKLVAKGRARKWYWCTAVFLIIVLIVFGLSWRSSLRKSQRINEKLAAIEAKRAIPDEENAAMLYYQLLEDYYESWVFPDFLDREAEWSTMRRPWLSKDYPELAQWVKEQQSTISKLLEACNKEKCRFPMSIDPQAMMDREDRQGAMYQWTLLLLRAGNNDIAEGRIEAAIEKYRCVVKIGEHLRQQLIRGDYLSGMAQEERGLHAMARFVMQGEPTETHLKMIEAAIGQTKDTWAEEVAIVRAVEQLKQRRQSSSPGWLMTIRERLYWNKFFFDPVHEIYLRLLTDRRGNRILIALKRYKNKTGEWPESLDEIRSSVPEEVLADPFGNGRLVYRPIDGGFKLYGKGKNKVDEGGMRARGSDEKDPPDDWLVWLAREGQREELWR